MQSIFIAPRENLSSTILMGIQPWLRLDPQGVSGVILAIVHASAPSDHQA